jgi:hypothetical protein
MLAISGRYLFRNLITRSMASLSNLAPDFKPFNLALIQLGQIGSDKAKNLAHARESILKAAAGEGESKPKPDLIVLPVTLCYPFAQGIQSIICVGVFQFTIWTCSFSRVCGNYRVHTR